MRFGNLGLRSKMMVGYAAPIVLLIALAGIAWMSIVSILDSVRSTNDTHQIIRQAQTIEADAFNMETGMRGYLLTGKEEYLQPYTSAVQTIHEHFRSLKKAVSNNPGQLDLLNRAEEVISAWQSNVADPLINLRREVGQGKDMTDMQALMAKGQEKTYSDKFRQQARHFIGTERLRLAELIPKKDQETDFQKLRDTSGQVDHIYQVMIQAHEILSAAIDMETGMRGYLLTGRDEFLEPYEDGRTRLFALIQKQKKLVSQDPEQLKVLGEMETVIKEWIRNVVDPYIALRKEIAESKTMEDVKEVVAKGEAKKIFDELRELMGTFRRAEEAFLQQRDKNAKDTEEYAHTLLLVGTIIIVGTCLLIAFLLAGTITKPVTKAMELAEAITRGDLTGHVDVKNRDEFGRLSEALNSMADNLRGQTTQVHQGILVLNQAASEITSTVTEVMQTIAQTHSAVSETSTTVEEVKHSAQAAGQKAKQVARDSEHAVSISQQGRQATEDTIHAIEAIKEQMGSIGDTVVKLSEQSQAIEEIIATVQDLADQSNLLAVNASIEAARAGDQGKGFAVVAHEIKSLADQSKEATDRIRTILMDTRNWVSAVVMATEQGNRAVDVGVKQSALAGHSIETLAGSVAASSHAATFIDTSSHQQAEGVAQISDAMVNIQSSVQQNRDAMIQLEGAATRLSDLGGLLKEMVEQYKV